MKTKVRFLEVQSGESEQVPVAWKVFVAIMGLVAKPKFPTMSFAWPLISHCDRRRLLTPTKTNEVTKVNGLTNFRSAL